MRVVLSTVLAVGLLTSGCGLLDSSGPPKPDCEAARDAAAEYMDSAIAANESLDRFSNGWGMDAKSSADGAREDLRREMRMWAQVVLAEPTCFAVDDRASAQEVLDSTD